MHGAQRGGDRLPQRRQVPLDNRDARLLDDREKVKRSHFHYVNTGTIEDLDAWVESKLRQSTKDGAA